MPLAPLTISSLTSCPRSLLATAIGDALGLPREGLSPARAVKLFPHRDRLSLLPGRGLLSDDTEHACMTAQALVASGGDGPAFTHHLARRLRWWVAALPAATGLATLRAGGKLWLGFSPSRSGVFSAGNGPCMRAPIIGVFARTDAEIVELTRRSTTLTHTDPLAAEGAIAVAIAAHHSTRGRADPAAYLAHLASLIAAESPILSSIHHAIALLSKPRPTTDLALELGLPRGVSGYVLHTVPIVIHAWLSHPNSVDHAAIAAIDCGGDTDTTAAIVGGIVGASPQSTLSGELLRRIVDWPRTINWITRLGTMLELTAADRHPRRPPIVPYPAALARNAAFATIVIAHGLRRLAPPY